MALFPLPTLNRKRHNIMAATTPSRSPFLAIPRELRNLIYEHAILSCCAAEAVTSDPTITDRPLISTVTAALHPPPPKRLLLKFRLRRSASAAERLRQETLRAASPGNLLLTNKQTAAEFTEEMFRHSKLVGSYVDSFKDYEGTDEVDGVALIGIPHPDEPLPCAVVPLRRVRSWEVQFNMSTMCGAQHSFMRNQGLIENVLGRCLEHLSGVRELTLRLVLTDPEEYIALCESSDAKFIKAVMTVFIGLVLKERRSVCVLKKIMTVGYGNEPEHCAAKQVFPIKEMVEHWDEDQQKMVAVSKVNRDMGYCRFYTKSIFWGFFWVPKQYQPYEKFGVEGSYDSTLRAALHGYNKWVEKGKPGFHQTDESIQVRKLLETQLPLSSMEIWRQKTQQIGEELHFGEKE